MVYFPHVSERVKYAEEAAKTGSSGSTGSLLSEDNTQPMIQRSIWPKLTIDDLRQSMEEIGFETRNRGDQSTDN